MKRSHFQVSFFLWTIWLGCNPALARFANLFKEKTDKRNPSECTAEAQSALLDMAKTYGSGFSYSCSSGSVTDVFLSTSSPAALNPPEIVTGFPIAFGLSSTEIYRVRLAESPDAIISGKETNLAISWGTFNHGFPRGPQGPKYFQLHIENRNSTHQEIPRGRKLVTRKIKPAAPYWSYPGSPGAPTVYLVNDSRDEYIEIRADDDYVWRGIVPSQSVSPNIHGFGLPPSKSQEVTITVKGGRYEGSWKVFFEKGRYFIIGFSENKVSLRQEAVQPRFE